MYKHDLALNNLERNICHKIQTIISLSLSLSPLISTSILGNIYVKIDSTILNFFWLSMELRKIITFQWLIYIVIAVLIVYLRNYLNNEKIWPINIIKDIK